MVGVVVQTRVTRIEALDREIDRADARRRRVGHLTDRKAEAANGKGIR